MNPQSDSIKKLKNIFANIGTRGCPPPGEEKPAAPVRETTPPQPQVESTPVEPLQEQSPEPSLPAEESHVEVPAQEAVIDYSIVTPDWLKEIQVFPSLAWDVKILAESGTQIAEEIRSLRTNMWTLRMEQDIKTITITSCRHNEGKTTLATNLALFMAKNKDRRVLLVDADMRRPKIKTLSNIHPDMGLDDIVEGRCEIKDALIYSERDNLYIIPSVRGHSNASEMLEYERSNEIIAELRTVFDYVIYDTPPVLSTTDPTILGQKVDGVILAIKANATQRESIEHAQNLLEQVNIKILGAVITQMRNYLPRYLYRYQYYHDYYHYYYTKSARATR
ncbi:CpsD/CapB family tyrosine-protein kinase [Planctomycetota bacterium]